MVFYFVSDVVQPSVTIYMGEDKHENEELIKWGWPEDIWFHVDDLSSAHVYLRLKQGETIDTISSAVLTDCAQLVKANSIEGNKKNNVSVVYTTWGNLKKTEGMDVGQVGFFSQKDVRKMKVEKRINQIVNRLSKTKVEKHPDLRLEREERDRKEREAQRRDQQEQKVKQKQETKEKALQAEVKSYTSLMKSENMSSNQEVDEDSDDFM